MSLLSLVDKIFKFVSLLQTCYVNQYNINVINECEMFDYFIKN
jgi:hypothetical protein